MEGIMNFNFSKNGGSAAQMLQDPEEFRRQGYMVIDFIAEYYKNVQNYPVRSHVEPGYLRQRLPTAAPLQPESMETILRDVEKDIMPGITHWQSPNHFAYFPSSASIAGVLGETLAAGFDVVGFNWISSPAATELESHVMDWMADMISLPVCFKFSGGIGGGTLLGTTCEAILGCVVAARDRALEKIGKDNIGKLVVYASDQTHCSYQKSAQIAGILLKNFRKIPTSQSASFALNPDAFLAAVQADVKAGLVPLFLCATVGTTSTAAVDPIAQLCHAANKYNIWVHVDAAYAGNACICPEYRHYIDGVEGATSFSFNAHKWFFTTLDCCCLWVKEPVALVNALTTSPEYLRNKATESHQVVDYKDWGITLSRRFRSLKLWMVIRSYGVNNLRAFIRGHVNMARHFQKLLEQDAAFEVVVPSYFATVCFRVSPQAILKHLYSGSQKYLEEDSVNEINRDLLESINSDGKIYMTHSVVGGVYVIRFAVGASLTEMHHVDYAWEVIRNHAHAMLARRLSTCANGGVSSNADTNCDREPTVSMSAMPVQVALNVIGPC